jgi:hypothetical protein
MQCIALTLCPDQGDGLIAHALDSQDGCIPDYGSDNAALVDLP